MSMKYVKLLAPMGLGFAKSLTFKWEWGVAYEVFNGEAWYPAFKHCESRRAARQFIRGRGTWSRKHKIKRRLVQTQWEAYNDSFTWNRGCGR